MVRVTGTRRRVETRHKERLLGVCGTDLVSIPRCTTMLAIGFVAEAVCLVVVVGVFFFNPFLDQNRCTLSHPSSLRPLCRAPYTEGVSSFRLQRAELQRATLISFRRERERERETPPPPLLIVHLLPNPDSTFQLSKFPPGPGLFLPTLFISRHLLLASSAL